MERKQLVQTFLSITLGTFLEWFDFSAFSALDHIIKKQFAVEGTVYWTIFALGFISRPLGAALFGWIGDTLGRRTALMLSVMGVALPSTLIGCLPTHSMIGQAAPILLAILRLCQGLALGGEFGSAMVYIQEVSPAGREGVLVNSMASSSKFATIVGNLMVILLGSVLSTEQMVLWGWRLPFLSSIITGGVALVLRQYMPESDEFTQRRAQLDKQQEPSLEYGHTTAGDLQLLHRSGSPSPACCKGTNSTPVVVEDSGPASGPQVATGMGLTDVAAALSKPSDASQPPQGLSGHGVAVQPQHLGLLDLAVHHRVPLLDLVLLHGEALALHIAYLTFNAALFYTVTTWLPSTLRSGGIRPSTTQAMLICNLLVLLSAAVTTGHLLDRGWMSLRIVLAATPVGVAGAFAMCAAMQVASTHLGLIWAVMAVMCGIVGVLNGNYPNTGAGLYPPECRLSGMNVGYNLAFGTFGGLTPVMNTLIKNALSPTLAVYAAAWWLLAVSGLSVVAVLVLMWRHPWCNYTRTQMWKHQVLPPWLQSPGRLKA